jgi:hypothetical protein
MRTKERTDIELPKLVLSRTLMALASRANPRTLQLELACKKVTALIAPPARKKLRTLTDDPKWT